MMFLNIISLTIVFIFTTPTCTIGQTYLRANGQANTYSLINSVLGGTAVEVPDCADPSFGPHITQVLDAELNRQVFVFHAHVTPDNDGCNNFDRQRTEIKTYDPSPEALKGRNGETVTFSWNFRLWSHFQPSSAFTHIHQLKAKGGDDGSPMITITPRWRSSGNELELIHINSAGTTVRLKTVPLTNQLAGKWIHVRELITYGTNGKYTVRMTNTLTGVELFSYTSNSIDMWRNGATYVRPKWGIYRSLTDKDRLKNEQIRFDTFCLAKGSTDCP